ncbi:hypothetical protein, partial [Wenyingzhuangia sp. 2_MG-2023]|uniref:hypothetical protein n=1 Tax=Wenyingzhuangia sp. 2_MG-2023 TaxID=3062639 RepID=UPI0026E3EDEF
FYNLSLIYSNYYYGLEFIVDGFQWDSGLENYNIKYDLKQYFNDDIAINYGVQAINYVFNHGKIQTSEPGTGIETNQ